MSVSNQKKKERGGSSSGSSSNQSRSAKAPTAVPPVKFPLGARPKEPPFKIPKVKATKAKAPTMATSAKAHVSTTPVVPQPKAPASSTTPVVAQPFHPVKSKVTISNVATETELTTSNGVRGGFAQVKPRETNVKANLEQTSNGSEVAGISENCGQSMHVRENPLFSIVRNLKRNLEVADRVLGEVKVAKGS